MPLNLNSNSVISISLLVAVVSASVWINGSIKDVGTSAQLAAQSISEQQEKIKILQTDVKNIQGELTETKVKLGQIGHDVTSLVTWKDQETQRRK